MRRCFRSDSNPLFTYYVTWNVDAPVRVIRHRWAQRLTPTKRWQGEARNNCNNCNVAVWVSLPRSCALLVRQRRTVTWNLFTASSSWFSRHNSCCQCRRLHRYHNKPTQTGFGGNLDLATRDWAVEAVHGPAYKREARSWLSRGSGSFFWILPLFHQRVEMSVYCSLFENTLMGVCFSPGLLMLEKQQNITTKRKL